MDYNKVSLIAVDIIHKIDMWKQHFTPQDGDSTFPWPTQSLEQQFELMKKKDLITVNERPTNCEFAGRFWMVLHVRAVGFGWSVL